MKAWPLLALIILQGILFAAHLFIVQTWIAFFPCLTPFGAHVLRIAVLALSFSFVASALLNFRHSNWFISAFYTLACVWLGFANYFFLGACVTWPLWYLMRALGSGNAPLERPILAGSFVVVGVVTTVYGLINARNIRVRHIKVELPGLPGQWRGRRAVMMSDLHLGNINKAGFCRKVVALVARHNPDVVFIPGDLFDGSTAKLDWLIAPLKELKPRFGIFFSTGNHEEFHDPGDYLAAIRKAGIRVLANERETIDGLHVLGVNYHETTFPLRVRTTLERLSPGVGEPSILLNHAPVRMPIVEQAGIALQLSGHTHGGQLFPYTFFTRRIFGPFTHGLHNLGKLQVYTSTGAGTWGPPIRVGSAPEIVVIEFA
ncbi:MAG: metallophosphoesterase [Terracidiphilus sp.]